MDDRAAAGFHAALFGDVDGAVDLPLDARRLASLSLTSPVHDVPDIYAEWVEKTRHAWRAGLLVAEDGSPLPHEVEQVQWLIRHNLGRYVDLQSPCRDYLYVLDFQASGGRNYVMFGHTTRLVKRLVEHVLAATPHGYALFAGWAAPPVSAAQPLEQAALNLTEIFTGRTHYRERFYDVPFLTGESIARAVFEYNTDWLALRGH